MRPQFITFEGIDGSGKSTHLRRAAAWLEALGVPLTVTHEPGGTPLGDAVRRAFLDPQLGEVDGRVEVLLVFACRRQHLLQVIEPALLAGRHVLCDRFTDSTRAYQGSGRGVPAAVIEEVDRFSTGGRTPDRTLLFDLPPEAARRRGHDPGRRGGVDRLDGEALDFYRRVREGYLELAAREPERIRVIDSSRAAPETAAQVEAALADLVAGAPVPEPRSPGAPEGTEP